MYFKYIKNDKELVITWYENDEQHQIVIADDAIYTGEYSDVSFNDYPLWAYDLKDWLNKEWAYDNEN